MTLVFISDDCGMEKVVLWSPPLWVRGELRFGGRATAGMQMGRPVNVTFVGEAVEMEAVCRLVLCGKPGQGGFVAAVVAWVADAPLAGVIRGGLPH